MRTDRDTELAEIDRAWRYHEVADNLLHQRTQSMILSQSFLVSGFILSTISFDTNIDGLNVLRFSLLVLGLMVALSYSFANYRLLRGLNLLKNNWLQKDEVYKKYVESVGNSQFETYLGSKSSKLLPIGIPMMFLSFWVVASATFFIRLG